MGWDIHLFKFVDGESADVDREAVRAVLEAADHRHMDPDTYQIGFPDGTGVEFFAPGLDREERFTGCEFNHAAGGEHLMEFILEVARAGDMVIMDPQMEDFVPILTRAEQADHLPSDFREDHPNVAVCGSPKELVVLLSDGYSAWKRGRANSGE